MQVGARRKERKKERRDANREQLIMMNDFFIYLEELAGDRNEREDIVQCFFNAIIFRMGN